MHQNQTIVQVKKYFCKDLNINFSLRLTNVCSILQSSFFYWALLLIIPNYWHRIISSSQKIYCIYINELSSVEHILEISYGDVWTPIWRCIWIHLIWVPDHRYIGINFNVDELAKTDTSTSLMPDSCPDVAVYFFVFLSKITSIRRFSHKRWQNICRTNIFRIF